MAWDKFEVKKYTVFLVAHNTPGYLNIYGYIKLNWQSENRATLWFYRNGAGASEDNSSSVSSGVRSYSGRFDQTQLRDCVDILRNEKPVFFHWNPTSKGIFLSTEEEVVGEEELP